MVIVIKTLDGFEPIVGNPTLTSIDGEQRAPLRAVLTLSKADQAGFGVYQIEAPATPEGKIVASPDRIVTDRDDLPRIERDYEDAPPPPRPAVRKSVVQGRLIETDKIDAAYAALTSNPASFARWFAPDRPEVYCDDPDAIGLVRAIGADPAVILAPEDGQ